MENWNKKDCNILNIKIEINFLTSFIPQRYRQVCFIKIKTKIKIKIRIN